MPVRDAALSALKCAARHRCLLLPSDSSVQSSVPLYLHAFEEVKDEVKWE